MGTGKTWHNGAKLWGYEGSLSWSCAQKTSVTVQLSLQSDPTHSNLTWPLCLPSWRSPNTYDPWILCLLKSLTASQRQLGFAPALTQSWVCGTGCSETDWDGAALAPVIAAWVVALAIFKSQKGDYNLKNWCYLSIIHTTAGVHIILTIAYKNEATVCYTT